MASEKEKRVEQPSLQLKDVYDTAQSVGEQFQTLIQQFGNSYFAELVNTVVDVLEHLETYVQEYQKLQSRICKLLLENDSFLKENQRLKNEAAKNASSQAALEAVRVEKAQLTVQLSALEEMNQELKQQLTESLYNDKKREGRSVSIDGVGTDSGGEEGPEQTSQDEMEVPRMRRRLVQTESELKRTRTKLLSSQSTLKCIVAENNSLKEQLEESKAELGLKGLQATQNDSNSHEPPKFYKKDLLVVLKERNELKEQMDALTHELNMARLRLRHYQSESENTRKQKERLRDRSNTKVRDIVNSITTDSIKIERKHKK